ncbi:AraC family transcriptional regulator [Allomuricauda sp. SCSIO 65647]|uniref:AraC family transcriptional regulator n=1 Tax=Allomuricauda sp. SCSIO 65647 TaxID=2908843 RepID=UPI001F23948D|nr:AraC family transcriptional regulator [Muricauda sp. SCSIO 65647]UJH67852.1 AraC family transcriptional regulator [Muricauda sp. SCSIO 65647]
MKVYPFIIPKPPNKRLIVEVDRGKAFFDKLHQHEEIQLSHIIQGRGKLFVVDSVHPFQEGDTFAIGSKSAHLFQSLDALNDSHMVSVFFTKNSFGDGFFEIPELKRVHPFFDMASRSFRLETNKASVGEMMSKLPHSNNFAKFLSFLKILKKICASKIDPLTDFVLDRTLSNNEGQRLQTVFDYVTKNFQSEIRLVEAASLVHMTPNAFCRFFKQRTNKTFFQFLIELRIEHARQLLIDRKDLNIAQISRRSGFNSITNFNRKFKESTGLTPSKYYQKMNRELPIF